MYARVTNLGPEGKQTLHIRVVVNSGAAIASEAGKPHIRGKHLTLYTNSISIASFPHQHTLVGIPITPLKGFHQFRGYLRLQGAMNEHLKEVMKTHWAGTMIGGEICNHRDSISFSHIPTPRYWGPRVRLRQRICLGEGENSISDWRKRSPPFFILVVSMQSDCARRAAIIIRSKTSRSVDLSAEEENNSSISMTFRRHGFHSMTWKGVKEILPANGPGGELDIHSYKAEQTIQLVQSILSLMIPVEFWSWLVKKSKWKYTRLTL